MLDERSRLVQEKEALQAELHLAFHNYKPKATVGTGEWTLQGWTGGWPPKGQVSGHPLTWSALGSMMSVPTKTKT